MYFLSEEERRYLYGRLLPRTRRREVHPELRGWNWRDPPLLTPYDVRLGVFEIAGKYCSTTRDTYMRRVMGVRAEPNTAMREGAALHAALVDVVLQAKRLVYARGASGCLAALSDLATPAPDATDAKAVIGQEPARTSANPSPSSRPPAASPNLQRRVASLRSFEYHRIVGRVQEVLARQPRVGTDSLVALALPVTLEQQLDGTLLGLSGHLSTDALTSFSPVVFDVKFGPRRDFHRLSTTAYALVLESLYESPVDVGCVVYAQFDGDRLLVERDLHVVDDELRQWFVDERDERMRMVAEETDPGKPERCADDCPCWAACRRG